MLYGVTARAGARPMWTQQEVEACKEHVSCLSFTKLGLWQDAVASNHVVALRRRDIMLLHGVRRGLSAESSMMPTPVHIGTVMRNARVFNFTKSSAETMETEALLETVVRLFTVLQARQTDYLLVGGVAMLQYVQGRNTEDIDLIMSVSSLQELPEIVYHEPGEPLLPAGGVTHYRLPCS